MIRESKWREIDGIIISSSYTRYGTVILATVQGYGLSIGLQSSPDMTQTGVWEI